MDFSINTALLNHFHFPALIIKKDGYIVSRSKKIASHFNLDEGDNFFQQCGDKTKNLHTLITKLANKSVGDFEEVIANCLFFDDLMKTTISIINEQPKLFLIEFSITPNFNDKVTAELADNSNNLLSLVDPNHQYLSVNRRYSDIWHLTKQEIEGQHVSKVLGEDAYFNVVKRKLDECFLGKKITYSDWFFSTARQEMMFLKVSYQPVINENSAGVNSVAVTVTDITDIGAKQANLSDKAYHDPLSKLNNRHALNDYFNQLMTERHSDENYCLIFLDLNKFKAINDHYGHKVGDDLIIAFSTNLKAMMRNNDFCCRWGGDEFVILLPILNDVDHAMNIKNLETRFNILQNNDYNIGETVVKLNFSFGVAFCPEQGTSLQELIQIADSQMYKLKTEYQQKII